jgi:uncharacterized protein YndB with AHSA1/START domain
MSAVEMGPVVKSLDVRRAAADAFRMFTDEITAWWPKAATRAKDAAGEKTVRIEIEPRVGGRVFETLNTGEERDWGEVLAFEPGRRFAFSWQFGRPKAQAGEVEVRFEPLGDDACRVTLTHAHWERLGADAEKMRGQYAGGWDFVFVDSFGAYAGRL